MNVISVAKQNWSVNRPTYLWLLNLKVTACNNVQSLYEDLQMITVGFDQWNSSVIYQYFGSS